jgi:hypothetical protein
MSFTIPSIFTAVDKITAPIRKMSRNVQSFAVKAEAGMAKFERRIRRLTPSLGAMGKQMIAMASTGLLIAGISSASSTIMNYEQANADLAAVMGTTIEKNQALAFDAERLGAITAKSATEVIGLQEAYARLGFSQKEILNVTEGTISGSIAMNAELAETAELTGAMVRTFKGFSSLDTTEILDKMTLSTQKSALNFAKLQTSLPIVAGAANAAGIPFDNLLALLGKLSDAGIDASMSSNALKNIFIESKEKGHDYAQVLKNIEKNQDKLTASNDAFGQRAAVPAAVLSSAITATAELTATLGKATKGHELSGVAALAAAKRLDTTKGSLTLLSSAYEGLILKMNKGTGAMSVFRVAVDFVTRNLETIATVAGVVVGAFIAMKVALLAGKIALFAYNVVVGIASVRSASLAVSVGSSTVAQNAQRVATYAVIAATWLWTAAMTAFNFVANLNPVSLIIIGVIALIAVIALVINKFDEWGAILSFIYWPLGLLINLVESLRRNWDMISDAFTNGGILAGLKAIGATMLDTILYPLQQALQLIEMLPGLDFGLSSDLQNFRAKLGVDVETGSVQNDTPAINNQVASQDGMISRMEEKKSSEVTVNFANLPNGATIENSGDMSGISIGSTW